MVDDDTYSGRLTLLVLWTAIMVTTIDGITVRNSCNGAAMWTLLHWRHNGHDNVSYNQPHNCLLNRLFRRRSKKTSQLRVTGLCVGNSPGTGEFPAQMASNAENVSVWWRQHGTSVIGKYGGKPGYFSLPQYTCILIDVLIMMICCVQVHCTLI